MEAGRLHQMEDENRLVFVRAGDDNGSVFGVALRVEFFRRVPRRFAKRCNEEPLAVTSA